MPIVDHAAAAPDKIATIMAGSGKSLTYGQLNERSIRLSHYLHAVGLRPGDVVALFMENNIRYHEVFWAAVRSGMYVCAVNKFLTAEEVTYILNDSGSKALVTSAGVAAVAEGVLPTLNDCPVRLMVDGTVAGFECYEDEIAKQSAEPMAGEPRGDFMNYSSGTTGRPKGIKRPLSDGPFVDPSMLDGLVQQLYSIGPDTIYLSPAPLYHAAPLGFTAAVHSLGGTNVVMETFDAVESLRLIEKYRVTHSQWVPTMFIRMLKLDEAERAGHDFSSHQIAIHAAAPCPIDVKHQMIDWWGPIIWEYYGGTEINGMTVCNSDQWLAHPGSVGSSILGVLHICDEAGDELPIGETGTIYFERDEMPFQYHGDPEKTEAAKHPKHPLWTKLGDVGYLDEDGFLYLTDRESFMIISGGVNIYPQEIEDCIVMHPKVADVAVFGVPNPDFGEEVKAVVQPAPGIAPSDDLAAEISGYASEHLANYKVPRSIDFEAKLPRLETGKLYKRLLKDRYWGKANSRIV
ncbi:MAG: acyl-CoA synthetase [Alphaproteobacteria bacterium]|jgi:fatty-acyl-CoA synthase|nr:acyl-CoA synthetase [Rhodospirillaceae bacterium]MDP6022426.1 acyl-CoA synthetase [Alphaproteobacteria bacterium]MDP6253385.1 acyl-CoA synthetase [Alphaproteobacteria bacterium]MDP7055485.1 acyl-CoA synthetase [Alphaproteobacteria bacterium]MDP7227988.1 acyl-CoA synthetase [Alphaproteobacteria bacterium]|tara:strand:- start:14887 stop:16437 length:1551 start_codon:yes stop_codon:yes gene_type:complete